MKLFWNQKPSIATDGNRRVMYANCGVEGQRAETYAVPVSLVEELSAGHVEDLLLAMGLTLENIICEGIKAGVDERKEVHQEIANALGRYRHERAIV